MSALAALSEVDVCNMALSHLGVSQGIQSLTPPDPSAQGQACALWYPKMRNWLLRAAPWNFAYVSQALASDATVFPGYGYAYQYPNDCVQLVAVTNAYGLRFGQTYWGQCWGFGSAVGVDTPKVPTKVVQSAAVPGEKAILCDLPAPAYAFYIQCVTDTALMDVMFLDTLSFYVAARIGGPLRADLKKVMAAMQAGEALRLQAIAQSMNESQQDPERLSPSISIR